MIGWHHRLNGHEFEQAPGVGDGQGGLTCCSPQGCKESDTTERLNNYDICHTWQMKNAFPTHTTIGQINFTRRDEDGTCHLKIWYETGNRTWCKWSANYISQPELLSTGKKKEKTGPRQILISYLPLAQNLLPGNFIWWREILFNERKPITALKEDIFKH